ncbi:MAG TPA: 6-carboxytetrahydropterin synthase QueD [Verrucomicrobiae bacterium]|nr:6-carboxytetrahydropterin synthase QueD [Verrucomicrobiae bacterium]
MSLYRLTVRHHFDAAHYLRAYPGPCANLHGHRWLVEVSVKGDTLDEMGMLVDFGEIKKALKGLLKTLDHSLLNDHSHFQTLNPTAENLAKFLFDELNTAIEGVALAGVKVYETPDAWAEYGEE